MSWLWPIVPDVARLVANTHGQYWMVTIFTLFPLAVPWVPLEKHLRNFRSLVHWLSRRTPNLGRRCKRTGSWRWVLQMHLTACSLRGNSKDMSRWNCIPKLFYCLKPTLQSCSCSHSCAFFFVYIVCCFVCIAGFSVLCVIFIRDITCSCSTMLETYKVKFSEAVHRWWRGSL